MYETSFVEMDNNSVIAEDNCWGFNSYYDRYIWLEDECYDED